MIEQFVQLSPETEFYLRVFIITAVVLAVPMCVAIGLLCYKAFFFLHNLTEFVSIIRTELMPVLKDVRLITEALENAASNASGNLKHLQALAANIGPQLGHAGQNLFSKLQDLLEPYIGSFGRSRKRSSSSNGASSQTPTSVETTF